MICSKQVVDFYFLSFSFFGGIFKEEDFMQRGKQNWTVQNIMKMYQDKHTLSFDHPIQRAAEQWTNSQKSLLLDSMLCNYPISNIYVLREDSEQLDEKGKPLYNFYVLDGKQRLTSLISYISGNFSIDDNARPITIEDEMYEIAGKYFCDLPEPVQYEILRYKFEIVTFEDCTDEDVETIFFRLNNSTALTKSQIAKSTAGIDVAILMNELLKSKFFIESANFTKSQIKSEDPQRVLFQSMMLLDSIYADDFILKDFSENTIMDYASSIKNQYGDKQRNIIKSAIEFLDMAFPKKNKEIRKIHIPMLVFLADLSINTSVSAMEFRQWWEYFCSEDDLMSVYKEFCSSGSTRLDKIHGRIAIILKSFCWYQDLDYPEEWVAILDEVEAKLEDMRAPESMDAEESVECEDISPAEANIDEAIEIGGNESQELPENVQDEMIENEQSDESNEEDNQEENWNPDADNE